MKKLFRMAILGTVLACTILLLIRCGNSAVRLDQNWTPPVAVSTSIEGLMGWIDLHRFRATLIGVNVRKDGSGQTFILNVTNNSWEELPVVGVPSGYVWGWATVDPESGRLLLADGYVENEQLVMKALLGTITDNAGLRNISERNWATEKSTLLGKTGPNVKLNYFESGRQGVGLGTGILNGSEAYLPYSLDAAEVMNEGKKHIVDHSTGPFTGGIFHSTDSGKTWKMEKVSEQRSQGPDLCQTTGCIYYFAGIYPLWFSCKPAGSDSWEAPKTITKTFARVNGINAAVGDGDTAHLCWMDRRHDKTRFNLTGPRIENCDIYYCRRKDVDREWSKEVLLSKGMLYCYAPNISAEGGKVVAVWAGVPTANKQHTFMSPNDIFYVTSKDGGKTWTQPQKVTDVAKDGITCGMPQVMLLNGMIHLLYTQGATQSGTQLTLGLTKLGEGSWPIYYTQRPFSK